MSEGSRTCVGHIDELERLSPGREVTSVRQQFQARVEVGVEDDAERIDRRDALVEGGIALRVGQVIGVQDAHPLVHVCLERHFRSRGPDPIRGRIEG